VAGLTALEHVGSSIVAAVAVSKQWLNLKSMTTMAKASGTYTGKKLW